MKEVGVPAPKEINSLNIFKSLEKNTETLDKIIH